ncbi:hypothetical protein [Streptomyces lydicus]|uniref:hypothetical protein n=1 Tax=Streptomyces lydicus TaxID=47763 RepID=UPI0036E50F0B
MGVAPVAPGRRSSRPPSAVRRWSTALGGTGGGDQARAAHRVFTDYAALAPALQAAGLMSAADRNALTGPAGPARAVPEVRHHLRAFFTRQLSRSG